MMDDGLKQRLIGAIVLLAIAVIFIPALFDRQPIAPVDTQTQIPRMPEVVMEPIEVAQAPEVPSPAPQPEAMLIPEETQATTETPEPPSLNDNGVPKGWVLQIISYSEEAKANALRDQLIKEKFPAYVRSVATDKGTFYRVFVGPKLDKAALLKDKSQIDTRFKLTSLVLDMTPDR